MIMVAPEFPVGEIAALFPGLKLRILSVFRLPTLNQPLPP